MFAPAQRIVGAVGRNAVGSERTAVRVLEIVSKDQKTAVARLKNSACQACLVGHGLSTTGADENGREGV